jgi:uncharacterized protein (DUF2225 family)
MVDVKLLNKIGTVKKFPKDKWICKEGEIGNEMYIVLTGKLEVYKSTENNTQVKIAELKEGDFFGEMSLFDNSPRSASIKTFNDSVLCGINKDNFQEFIAKQPMIGFRMIKSLSSRIKSLIEKIGEQENEIKNLKISFNESKPETHKKNPTPNIHKQYNIKNNFDESKYTFSKTIICPICNTKFKTLVTKQSVLKLEKLESDFRKRYLEFEPLWYSICSCPNCNFTNLESGFSDLDKNEQKRIKQEEKQLKLLDKVLYSHPRNIDEVFKAHYNAIHYLDTAKVKLLKIAKIWLQLSWLYCDVTDREMAKYSSIKAFELYYKAYYNSNLCVSGKVEQQICIIIAELLIKQNKLKEAFFHFQKALNIKSDDNRLVKLIRDRMLELRSK